MSKSRYNDDYEYEYEEEDTADNGKGSGKAMTGFLAILGVLLLALTILCVVLTGRLRRADSSIADLKQQLTDAKSISWSTPEPVDVTADPGNTETVPIPSTVPEEQVVIPATPTPTVEPTVTPVPTASLSNGLPSWITENNMAGITRRPKDDEWYGQPGKLYVTAALGLNMRSGIRTDINNIITQVKYGSEVMVYAASGNMRFVQDPKGNFGWVSNSFLSNELPAGVEVIAFNPVSSTPTPVATANPEATPAPTVAPVASAEPNTIPAAEAPVITG